MGALYTFDKPMQVTDYHTGVVNSVRRKAAFLGLLRDGPAPRAWKDTWAVDEFPSTFNGVTAEGAAKTDGYAASVPFELEGICEIFRSRGYHVTNESELFKAGYETGSATARSQAKDAENIALSMEKIALSAQPCRDRGDGVERLTRGAFAWLSPSAQAFLPVPASLRPTSAQYSTGALSAYEENAFIAQGQAAALQINDKVNLMGYVGLKLKQKMSLYNYKVDVSATLADTRQVLADAKKVALMVDFFEYDWGTVKTLWMPRLLCDYTDEGLADGAHSSEAGLFVDTSMWEMSYKERITHVPQDDSDGAGKRGFHKSIFRLTCKNPMGQFAVAPAA